MTNKMMNNRIDKIRALEAQASEINKQIEALKNELKAELDNSKVDSISTGLHNIFYLVYERAQVDSAKLKEDGLYDKYCKKATVCSFKITDAEA